MWEELLLGELVKVVMVTEFDNRPTCCAEFLPSRIRAAVMVLLEVCMCCVCVFIVCMRTCL